MPPQTRTRRPPASRATPPPRRAGGRHRRAGGRHRRAQEAPARRLAAGARSTARSDVRPAARAGYQRTRQAAEFTTVRKGGQHALMAEFLLFLGIVAFRAIADYVPGDQGQPTEGTSKGQVTPRSGQLGPLPVLAAGFAVFFVLSFLAARGGTWAKVAAAFGLVVDVALLMKSLPELNTVSQGFHNADAASQAAQASTYVQPVGYQGLATVPVPDATGIFPFVTPNMPPVPQGAGQNPGEFTQP